MSVISAIELINIYGQKCEFGMHVLSDGLIEIDVSNLSSGIYQIYFDGVTSQVATVVKL